MKSKSTLGLIARSALFSTAACALVYANAALAEDQQGQGSGTTAPAGDEETAADIIITGYRASLESSTLAKREATGFQDSIFAEDIGKFPDTNIAESLNRIPGITISRGITGEGLQVAIRGLGTNFTRVLLNNAPIAVASSGGDGAQSTNREVDLDIFPTELFTQITVSKSPTPSMLEGGAAGTVNLRSARPFDHPGTHVTYSGQATNNSNTDKWGYRGSILASTTMGDFGVLIGVAAVRNQINTQGFESVGWTNPNLSATQNTGTRNSTGGGNWTIPGTVPSNAGIPGVAAGTTVDQAFLLAQNPGVNITQIDNGIIPRLGRPVTEYGTKDRINAIASLEYRGDAFHAYVDGMYGHKANDMERVDMNWVGRNGAMIPVKTSYDLTDCSNGCTVTKGTYYNAQWFLEFRPWIERLDYWGVNPGFDLELGEKLKLSVDANYTRSTYRRETPTVLVITPANSGVTVDYDNSTGLFPTIKSNVDLNSPASFGWPGGRVNLQEELRTSKTKGVRGSLDYGDEKLKFRVGGAYDDVSRLIEARDNSQAWQNAVCGDNPSIFLPGPNGQPPCEGLSTPTPGAGYPTYPGLGTGYSQGQPATFTYGGSLVPNGATLQSFLKPGPLGFVTVDWAKFKAASKYDQFYNSAPAATGSNTGASGGYVRERTLGFFGEINGKLDIGDNRLDFNAGVRWVHTKQTIGGFVSITDPRNATDPDGAGPLAATCASGNNRDGSCYPNKLNFVYTNATYSNVLPSATAAFHIGEHAVARAAVSRTMTRANPNSMLPGLNFSSPSADVGSVGNPSLAPFLSTNFDFGFEYYTGQEGYVGVAAFRKAVTGFTVNGNSTVPFASLAAYGVTYDTLSPTQQAAINSRGGPGTATVVLTQQVNASGTLLVNGLELNWVQPLDFLLGRVGLNGFGFAANATLISQSGSGAAPAVATGVSPFTYNVTAYYEKGGISARLSTTFNKGSIATNANQNGITAAAIYGDSFRQWDFGASLDLATILGTANLPELTVDVQNITKAKQRSYFQFANAANNYFSPGRQVMIGLRGRF